MKQYLTKALEIADAGGKILERYWGKLTSIHEKAFSGDLVTNADEESEELIISMITDSYPDHEILGEETGIHERSSAEFLWVIDPLDGTTNYTHTYPMVAISIALLHWGNPVVGVIYNPILKELFYGAAGEGVFLGNSPIHVSKTKTLEKSLLATGFAYDRRETSDNNYREFCHLTNSCQGVRRAGSAAIDLAYVACGRLDGHWEIGLKPWDVAAGALLIQEAGGVVSSFDAGPFDIHSGVILATNGYIHKEISDELVKVRRGEGFF